MTSVLLIDDDLTTQRLFSTVLNYYDATLTVATSEFEALQILSGGPKLDVVVLDIRLPGNRDGYKVLSRLRELPGFNCPVVATTAYYTTDSLPEFERRGFDGYLLKPIQPDNLLPYLHQVIARKGD